MRLPVSDRVRVATARMQARLIRAHLTDVEEIRSIKDCLNALLPARRFPLFDNRVRRARTRSVELNRATVVFPEWFSHLRGPLRGPGFKREFDPGSERTLAACLTHASRTRGRP